MNANRNTTEREIARKRDIARKLEPTSRPQPPADLLGRIRAEIPEHFDLPAPGPQGGHGSSWTNAPWLRIAAAIVVIAGAGWIALRLQPDRRAALEAAANQVDPADSLAQATPEADFAGQPARQAAAQTAEEPAIAAGEAGPTPASEAAAPGPVDRLEAELNDQSKARRSLVAAESTSPPIAQRDLPKPEVGAPIFTTDPASADEAPSVGMGQVTATAEALAEPGRLDPALRENRQPVPVQAPPPPRPEELRRQPSRLQAEMVQIPAGVAAPEGAVAAPDVRQAPTRSRPAPMASAAAVTTPATPKAGRMTLADEDRFRTVEPSAWVDTRDDRLSTFGLDVDTGSYTLGRRYLEQGQLPPAASVRAEEWLNAFDYGDPAPRDGDFALRLEGAPSPFADGHHLLRIGVRARDVAAANRPPADLVFLVDVSGSMDQDDRLPLVKQSLRLLIDQLRDGDTVGLVVYGNDGRVVLEPTGDRSRLRRAIDSLRPEGSTNLEAGLWLAYEMAARRRGTGSDRLRRVILCSDGVANVGRTDPEDLLRRIADFAASGIELTTIGFGMGDYNDALMERLADRGDGRYAYVDDLAEARRVLVENLTGTLLTVASDARIQVELDPETVARYRLIGYLNRALPDQAFRDPRTDAGEIGAGHAVTALYEVELRGGASGARPLARATLRYRSKASGEFVERSAEIRRSDLATSWRRATPSLQLAAVVAELAESLATDEVARANRLDRAFREGQRLVERFPGRSDVAELVALAGRARDLAAAAER